MKDLYSFYKGKRVLVTGHTGFKGFWLSLWLKAMGAEVYGMALEAQKVQCGYSLSGIGDKMAGDWKGDIRRQSEVDEVFGKCRPEIVFHLAAQPLVRQSYREPVETYETNVMGTIHVMEAMRRCPETRVGVMITTDKCYENREQMCLYKEDDALGGYDPYSSSKGAAEIAISSWRRSFMNPSDSAIHGKALASVRAGNVIGGGDWAEDRIVPDCIRAWQRGETVSIRSPKAIRPWQHVLEPLSGYLLLAMKMWDRPHEYAESWNFGPEQESVSNVWEMASTLHGYFGKGGLQCEPQMDAPHEAQILMLDITKAKTRLGWAPRLSLKQALKLTADWYARYEKENVMDLCMEQIDFFMK